MAVQLVEGAQLTLQRQRCAKQWQLFSFLFAKTKRKEQHVAMRNRQNSTQGATRNALAAFNEQRATRVKQKEQELRRAAEEWEGKRAAGALLRTAKRLQR